jgi:putative ABC transport system ATP-binding protein
MTASIPSPDGTVGGATAIEVVDVHKAFVQGRRRVDALRGVDLRIDEPGFYAIMGASGSGKSTLLHLLGGLDRPDRGTINVAGEALAQLSERALTMFRRHRVGIVFQQFNLIPTMTALENVMLPGVLDGRVAGALRDQAAGLLADLGLGERAEHRPDALSGGEQQRVAIARALLFEPRILLADEPTGNLDSTSSEQVWGLLRDLSEQRRMCVIMVTHEAAAAAQCRRVFVIRDGEVAGAFDVDGADAGQLATRAEQLGRASR